jgi:prepilin-type processing-associated H-X9-DG protein
MNTNDWQIKMRDGKVYGPVDTGTLKKWIQENRVSAEDDVSSVGSEGWKKISKTDEFASLFVGEKKDFLLPPAEERTLTTQVVSDAWKVLKTDPFPIIGTFLLYLIIVMGVSFIRPIGRIINLLIAGPLIVGLSRYCLGKIRNQEIGVVVLFDGFKVFLPALGAYLLIYILTVLGFLFLIVPGIIVALAFSLTYFFILDKNMGPLEAMKASFNITKGYRWRVLAIMALCGLINLLGILCLGIGILVTIPLATLALGTLYQRLNTGNIHKFQKQTNVKEVLLGAIIPIIVIIAMMAAMLLPALGRARDMARRALSASNLKDIGLSLLIYSKDNEEQLPPTLMGLYPKYVEKADVFWCPSDRDPKPTDITNNAVDGINSARISYQYNSGYNISDSANIPLVWDNGCGSLEDNHRKGGNVLYLDGHVEWVSCEEWENPTHGENSYPCKPSLQY